MSQNIEIKRIINILKAKKLIISLILISFILFGIIYSYTCTKPKYKATSTLLLIPNSTTENSNISNSDLTVNSELILTYSNIAKQSKILKTVINNLELDMNETELLNSIQVNVLEDTYIIELGVTNANPEQALKISKELSNVFLDEIKRIYHLNNIGIVDAPQLPKNPYNINHTRDIFISTILGIIVSSLTILIFYLFDNTIKSEDDLEEYVKIKSLGKIPVNINSNNEIINKNNSKSYITECINTIRTNILYMSSLKESKTILITSSNPGEGKSWVSTNLSAAFAKTNKKVLLIDADLRKGRLSKIFGFDNNSGITDYLYAMTGNNKQDLILSTNYIKQTEIPNLHVLTSGTIPPNPSELLACNSMKRLLAILKKTYDLIIIDAPPCNPIADSIILSTLTNFTIVVACASKTKIKDLIKLKKSIEMVNGKIIGCILNKTTIIEKNYEKSYYYINNETNEQESAKQNKITVEDVIKETLERNKELQEKKQLLVNNINKTEDNLSIREELSNLNKKIENLNTTYSELSNKITNNSNSKINLTQNDIISEEQIKLIIQEEMLKLNYTNQLNKIRELIENLNKNYIELSQKIENYTNNENTEDNEITAKVS